MDILVYMVSAIAIISGVALVWDAIKNKKAYTLLIVGFCSGIAIGYSAKSSESNHYRDAATEYADQYESCKEELAKKIKFYRR